MLGGGTVNLRLIYSAKINFEYESKIKTLADKQKLRNFILKRPKLKKKNCYSKFFRREHDSTWKHESMGGGKTECTKIV